MSAMYCQHSGKLRFQTPAEALKAAERIMGRRLTGRQPRGVAKHYQCEVCKDWHIWNATNLVKARKDCR